MRTHTHTHNPVTGLGGGKKTARSVELSHTPFELGDDLSTTRLVRGARDHARTKESENKRSQQKKHGTSRTETGTLNLYGEECEQERTGEGEDRRGQERGGCLRLSRASVGRAATCPTLPTGRSRGC